MSRQIALIGGHDSMFETVLSALAPLNNCEVVVIDDNKINQVNYFQPEPTKIFARHDFMPTPINTLFKKSRKQNNRKGHKRKKAKNGR